MENSKSDSGKSIRANSATDEAVSPASGTARWHAPVFKRLDVDLTATIVRTSNEPGTGEGHFSS